MPFFASAFQSFTIRELADENNIQLSFFGFHQHLA
jgi:hypothetical protein